MKPFYEPVIIGYVLGFIPFAVVLLSHSIIMVGSLSDLTIPFDTGCSELTKNREPLTCKIIVCYVKNFLFITFRYTISLFDTFTDIDDKLYTYEE